MSVEDGGDSRDIPKKKQPLVYQEYYTDEDDGKDVPKPISDKLRRQWEAALAVCKLDGDYWNRVPYKSQGCWHKLSPMPTYKEWESKYEKFNIGYANFIVGLSDPEAVAALDKLTREFNADLERIKREGDEQAIYEFIDRVHQLLYKENRR